MKFHIYMLAPPMYDWIFWKSYGWTIIAVDCCTLALSVSQFLKDPSQPNFLTCTEYCCNELNLYGRQSHNWLFFWRPWDYTSSKHEDVTRSAFPTINVSCIITVNKPYQFLYPLFYRQFLAQPYPSDILEFFLQLASVVQ